MSFLHEFVRFTVARKKIWLVPIFLVMILVASLIVFSQGSVLAPGVGIVNMPGHSPGSLGVSVETAEGLAVITGDALHYAYVLETGVNPLVFWDDAAARASIQRVRALADIIYPGHDRPFRRSASGQVEYLTPFQLTLNGLLPDMDGLTFEPPTRREPWIMPGVEEQAARLAEQ